MIIRKSCHKLEKEIVVPQLGRMNTNVKCNGGLRGEALYGRSRLNVNMAMSSTIDNALFSSYQEIAGDIVFPMVSGIFKENNHDFLQAKSLGYTSEQAQSIAIGKIVQLPGLADDFGPLDRSPTPPPPPLLQKIVG